MNDKQLKSIERTKFLIKELNNIQALYYDALVDEIGVKEEMDDWLFDYMYNQEEDLSFEDFLARYGLDLTDVIDE